MQEKSALEISIVKRNPTNTEKLSTVENYQAIVELDRKLARLGLTENTTEGESYNVFPGTKSHENGAGVLVKDVDWISLGPKSSTQYFIKPKRS